MTLFSSVTSVGEFRSVNSQTLLRSRARLITV